MTPPRLHKVEQKKTKTEKIVSFLNAKLYMRLYILALILLIVLFIAICIKTPTYGWIGS